MQFARTVYFNIKDGKRNEFDRTFESEVLPMLRKEDGFREELTLVSPDHCLGISIWKDRNSATRYHESTYPKVLEKLNPVIEGKPKVENYEVAMSTVTA